MVLISYFNNSVPLKDDMKPKTKGHSQWINTFIKNNFFQYLFKEKSNTYKQLEGTSIF